MNPSAERPRHDGRQRVGNTIVNTKLFSPTVKRDGGSLLLVKGVSNVFMSWANCCAIFSMDSTSK